MSERHKDRETVADSSVTAEVGGFARAETAAGSAPAASEPASDEPTALPPGTIIGRFVVQQQIGAGGMGVVVAAHYACGLAIREQTLGKDNVRTAYALEMMARLRLAERRFADALPMARRILEIRERGLPPGSQAIGDARGAYERVEPDTKRTKKLRELAAWAARR
ncbi:MAG TPA: tetratricopeptide repeat protein [Kofleriaceae bacterium]